MCVIFLDRTPTSLEMGINMAISGYRGPDPFVDFLFVAPSEDETPEDAWFLRL